MYSNSQGASTRVPYMYDGILSHCFLVGEWTGVSHSTCIRTTVVLYIKITQGLLDAIPYVGNVALLLLNRKPHSPSVQISSGSYSFGQSTCTKSRLFALTGKKKTIRVLPLSLAHGHPCQFSRQSWRHRQLRYETQITETRKNENERQQRHRENERVPPTPATGASYHTAEVTTLSE